MAIFTLQWHVTVKCPQTCAHCYMGRKENGYWSELRNELDYDSCKRIIDDFSETFQRWGMPTRITFTGGDPLLKKEIYEIIRYSRSKGIQIGILGNPNFLDDTTAQKLKSLGVDSYQLSLDGTETTHDELRRRKGSFQDTIRAIHVLEKVGINSPIMFTLHKLNANELIPVIRTVAKEGASSFDFARLVPSGNGEDLSDQMLEPQEYRSLLLEVLNEYRILQEQGCRTRFGRKDHLWTLLYQELGLLKSLPQNSNKVYGGCGIGWKHLTILADGRVLACRRLPIEIGKVPNQKIGEIFIKSRELNQIRQIENMEKCSKCNLLAVCRGCPAIPYATTGDYLAPDPQCWKII